ncbi:MAG: hypothetical protein ACI9OU_001088 [Candidatus Promineifilaceae bacterium]|jgi:hypothetical protein
MTKTLKRSRNRHPYSNTLNRPTFNDRAAAALPIPVTLNSRFILQEVTGKTVELKRLQKDAEATAEEELVR